MLSRGLLTAGVRGAYILGLARGPGRLAPGELYPWGARPTNLINLNYLRSIADVTVLSWAEPGNSARR